MTKIHQWGEIKARFHDGLILGNGASIAVHPGFAYASLFQAAQENNFITPAVAGVFAAFGVDDFELVLRRLWQTKVVNETLGIAAGRVEKSYLEVRTALIQTVRHVHITHEDATIHLRPIYAFMQGFETVISLNHDLLVYWAAMYSRDALASWFKDCFVKGAFAEDWESMRRPYAGAEGTTLFFYPHGNLSLARSQDEEESKLRAQGQALLSRVLEVWESGEAVPLFVCEGTSKHKIKSISGSSYLQRVSREVIPKIGNSLVIYGWGLAEQDDHILKSLSQSNCRRAAVSVHHGNQNYIAHAEKRLRNNGIEELIFFDSSSLGCWNNAAS